MQKVKYNLIYIPLEFKVACTVYRQKIQEVLQIFVDHVSIYDSLTGEYSQGFAEATRTISSYSASNVKRNDRSKAFVKCKDVAITCLNNIFKQARNPKGKASAKRKRCLHFVDALYQVMERPHCSSEIIYLDENSPIKLTKDFCILCELNNSYPKEFLEYFMGRISVAESQAMVGLKIIEHNFTYDFFLDIAKGFGRNIADESDLTDMEIAFYDRMEEMRLEIYNVRDRNERTEILRDFYLSHHRSMNQLKNPNHGN
jgi:hypothetical protein